MPTCVAVTRDGWGECWSFPTKADARNHPLIQSTDPIIETPEDIRETWNHLFLPRMCSEVLGNTVLYERGLHELSDSVNPKIRQARIVGFSEEVLDELLVKAAVPPTDPKVLMDKIASDRRLFDIWYQNEQVRRKPVTEANTTTKTAAAAKEAKPAKEAAPKTLAGLPLTAKITLLADKDGKAYGADNNPKRAGSKSHGTFALYKNGQTLEQAQAAGVTAADIKWDIDHKFISVA